MLRIIAAPNKLTTRWGMNVGHDYSRHKKQENFITLLLRINMSTVVILRMIDANNKIYITY